MEKKNHGVGGWLRGVGMKKLQKPDIDMKQHVTRDLLALTTLVPNSERWLHLESGL